ELIDAYDVEEAQKKLLDSLDCVGALVPFNKKGQKYFCVVNGDLDDLGDSNILAINLLGSNLERVTVSFECLRQFFDHYSDIKEVAEAFTTNKLKIVAYTKDDTKDLTKAEIKKVQKWDVNKEFPVKAP